MRVWHGSPETFDRFRDGLTFFSTSRDFASDHSGPGGGVAAFEVPEAGLLDSRDPDALRSVTGGRGLIDPYDGTEYDTEEAFLDACGSDTWEALEAMADDVRASGYAGMILTEGGVVNVALFDPSVADRVRDDDPSP